MTHEYAEQLFLQEKPTLALLAIWSFQKTYASVITKEINSTFAHTTKILAKMQDQGLVKFTVDGRVKYVELTEHGYRVVDALKALILAIEGDSAQKTEENGNNISNVSKPGDVHTPDDKKDLTRKHIDRLHKEIIHIYNSLFSEGSKPGDMKMKIGPFSRDIQLLLNSIEENEEIIDEEGLDKLNEIQNIFEQVMR